MHDLTHGVNVGQRIPRGAHFINHLAQLPKKQTVWNIDGWLVILFQSGVACVLGDANDWLPKAGLSSEDAAKLAAVNARWNGVGLDDITEIARRGGVVLLVPEPDKAEVVLALLKRRLVSRLFVSAPLAAALEEILKSRWQRVVSA